MSNKDLLSVKNIQKAIYEIRGKSVMMDFDLAELYGVQLFIRLSANLDIGMRTLYRAVFLYQEYPILSAPTNSSPNLSWNNYTILMSVKDAQKRKEYERKIH